MSDPATMAKRTGPLVLLGAGASVEAGLPLARELTERAVMAANSMPDVTMAAPLNYVVSAMQLSDVRNGGRPDLLPDIERVVSAVKMLADRENLEVSPFIQQWDGQIGTIDTTRPSLLHVTSKLERSAQNLSKAAARTVLGGERQSTKRFVEDLRAYIARATETRASGVFDQLANWLTRRLVVDLKLAPQSSSKLRYFTPLLEWAQSNEVRLATLNYDLTIETAAAAVRIRCERLVENWSESGILRRPSRGSTVLMKLHGSIDWETDEDGHMTLSTGLNTKPTLVYGQRDKLRADGPFLQLLEAFRQALWKSSNLVIVGYSFHDLHINTTLRRWMQGNPQRRLLIADPYLDDRSDRTRQEGQSFEEMWQEFGPNRLARWALDDSNPGYARTSAPPQQLALTSDTASSLFRMLKRSDLDSVMSNACSN